MRNQVRVLLTTLLFISCTALAVDIQQIRIDWFEANQETLIKMIRDSESTELVPIMETLGSLWLRRDGALGVEVAPYIAETMIQAPLLAFSWFSDHAEDYEVFVSQSQQVLFTDFSNEAEAQNEMEYLRKRLAIKSAEFASSNNPDNLLNMASKLSSHLQKLKVQVVD